MMRMAELLGGLSLACDVASANVPEKALRTALFAVELGRRHGLGEAELRDAYYVSLLRFLGCVGFAHEEAHVYGAGDDIATRELMAMADDGDPLGTVRRIVTRLGRGGALGARAKAVARILGDGVAVAQHAAAQCDASIRFAEMTAMGQPVARALSSICERWDGKGHPAHLEGEAIPIASRLHHIGDVVDLAVTRAGRDAAVAMAKRRAGGQLDPALVRTFAAHADELLAIIDSASVWDRFLAAEPRPHLTASEARTDDVARAFAHFADLKSTWTLGHSTGVAELAARAAKAAGLAESDERDLRRAGWLHDLGRVSVPNGIWDKPGKLTVAEWERVRMHAYWSERALWQARPLRPLAQLAAASHERSDGSGYHRALPGGMLARAARILAAADVYQAIREARPHRPARDRDAATKELLAGGRRRPARSRRGRRRPRRRRRAATKAAALAVRSHRSRGRCAAPRRTRPLEQADRRCARDFRQDRPAPRRPRLCKDRSREPRRRCPVRD
ncbi:MAG: HD domain-containing protein [Deltaproteobacteria bacterium]|nr:HD domain-containing protein [Deltaproteobacteria bacterium]